MHRIPLLQALDNPFILIVIVDNFILNGGFNMNILKLKQALFILLLTSISSSMFGIQLPKGNLFPLWWSYKTEGSNKKGSQTYYYNQTNYPAVFPIYVTKERLGRVFQGTVKMRNTPKPEEPEFRYHNIVTWIGLFVVGTGITLYEIKHYFQP